MSTYCSNPQNAFWELLAWMQASTPATLNVSRMKSLNRADAAEFFIFFFSLSRPASAHTAQGHVSHQQNKWNFSANLCNMGEQTSPEYSEINKVRQQCLVLRQQGDQDPCGSQQESFPVHKYFIFTKSQHFMAHFCIKKGHPHLR